MLSVLNKGTKKKFPRHIKKWKSESESEVYCFTKPAREVEPAVSNYRLWNKVWKIYCETFSILNA